MPWVISWTTKLNLIIVLLIVTLKAGLAMKKAKQKQKLIRNLNQELRAVRSALRNLNALHMVQEGWTPEEETEVRRLVNLAKTLKAEILKNGGIPNQNKPQKLSKKSKKSLKKLRGRRNSGSGVGMYSLGGSVKIWR
jgi:hypothetical protein